MSNLGAIQINAHTMKNAWFVDQVWWRLDKNSKENLQCFLILIFLNKV